MTGRLYGSDIWPGYYNDPTEYYLRRRVRRGFQMPERHDDPIRGMHVALGEWAGEPYTKPKKGTKRKARLWRIRGLLALERPLTPEEDRELDQLLAKHTAAKKRKRDKKTKERTTNTERKA
jgi:hypothetical protein